MRPWHLLALAATIFVFASPDKESHMRVLTSGQPIVEPYGSAPESLTWREPPSFLRTTSRFGSVTLPHRITEMDVWVGTTYRLRTRIVKAGLCFTRAHGQKCLAAYEPTNRDIYSYTRQKLTVYGWAD